MGVRPFARFMGDADPREKPENSLLSGGSISVNIGGACLMFACLGGESSPSGTGRGANIASVGTGTGAYNGDCGDITRAMRGAEPSEVIELGDSGVITLAICGGLALLARGPVAPECRLYPLLAENITRLWLWQS